MTGRTRSFSLVVSVLVMLSLATATVAATAVNAASSGRAAQKHAAKTTKKATKAAKCTKRNKTVGLIKMSDWQFPDTLNPAQAGAVVDGWVGNAIFDSLFGYDSHAKLFAQMATKVPTVKNGGISKDGKTFIVDLRPGMHFSNGKEITAQDVVFSWKAGMDKASGPYCLGSCDAIARIDTKGKYQLIFHMKQPYAPALDYAINGFQILPRTWPNGWASGDVHAAANTFYSNSKFNYEGPDFPSNGAYQVQQFVNNDRIVLQPMKYYSTMTCGAYLKQLIFVFYSSKPGLIAAAAARQTDVTRNYTAADLPELAKHKTYKTDVVPSFSFEHLEFNVDKEFNGKPNPLSNQNVRLAMALALDKLGLIRSALGLTAKQAKLIEAWSPWVNTPALVQPFADKSLTGQWDPAAKKFQVNTGSGQALADAKKLLAKTPYKDGFSLDFYTTSGNPVRQSQAAVMLRNWATLGIKLNLNFVPSSKLFGYVWANNTIGQHGAFQVAMFATSGKPDPDQFKFNLVSRYIDREQAQHSSTNINWSGIHDKVFDKDMPAAAKTTKRSTRATLYSAVQVEMNKQAYWVPLFYRPNINTTDGKVKNFAGNPTQVESTWNVYNWRVSSS